MEDRPMERKSSSFPQEVAHLCPGDCQCQPRHHPQHQGHCHLIISYFQPLPEAQGWSMRHCECVEVSRQSWSQATSCSSPPWTRSPPSCSCSSDPRELVDLDQEEEHLEVTERRGLQGPGGVARTPRRTSVPSCWGCSPSPHTAWKEK